MAFSRKFAPAKISRYTVFKKAFERITGVQLPKCPPILYLPVAEREVLNKVAEIKIIADKPLKQQEIIDYIGKTQIDTLIQHNPGRRLHFQDRCI